METIKRTIEEKIKSLHERLHQKEFLFHDAENEAKVALQSKQDVENEIHKLTVELGELNGWVINQCAPGCDIKPPVKWVDRKSWDEFRESGLFMFINTILHAFGWDICVEVDNGKTVTCFPTRVKFRGFSTEDQDEMHKRIGVYLEENATDLKKDTLL